MFEANVATPNFLAATPPATDTSWLAQLPQTYRQGVLQQRQVDIANAGQDTTPPGASAPDMTALTNRLMQLGAYDQAGSLMQLGLRQKLLGTPSSLNDPLGQSSASPQAPAAPAGNIPASVQGANPQVVAYVQQAAQQRHMNPNVALAVSGAEGLKGFDPNGSVNPGDGNSSFGPFQLHYGNVPGSSAGNQVAGLGDDFTKATGLDARDPSTWRQQVDFALDHAAKYGWSAFHGARALGIGNFAGIGGQPSNVAAYAPQPSAAPAQAAIGAATGQQPYRVASLGPVSAPAGAAPAPSAPQPQQSFGAVNGAPTANTATSQMVSPAQWAAKFNPNDPSLAGKIADAIGIDPNEQIDVQDRNIRAAVLPVLQASRSAATASPAQSGAPASSTDRPASNTHPFGPGATNAESGNTVAPLHAPAPQGGSIAPASTSNDASSDVAPTPVATPRFAPPPVSSPTSGPDAPGLPAAYQDPGGGQRYVNDILNMASRFEDAGLTGRAKVYMARAQQVQAQLEAAQKSQLDLQTHNAELSPDMKAYQQAQQQGFNGTFMDYQGALEQQKATANASGRNLVLTPGEKEYNQAVSGGFQGTQADYEAAKGAQIEEAKGQASYLGGMPKQLATAADAARQTSGSIDQMLTAAQGFRMGSGAQMDQGTRKVLQGAFTRLGVDDPALNDSTASYEDFGKLAGVLNRQAAQQVGGRTGVQEMQLIGSTLPSPEMTYDGFRGVASSLKGSADYTIARQQASQDWLSDPSHNNSLRGFDAAFNRNVSPSAFWLARLQTDQPDLFSQTVQKLGQSAQGRALLTKAKAGMTWANGNGLLDQ